MRYAFIERHKKVWPIVTQCRVLEVSVSGYGQYRARQSASGSAIVGRLSDMALLVHVRAIFHEMKGAYVSNRIQPRPLFASNNDPPAARESGV
jgi:putative transposase